MFYCVFGPKTLKNVCLFDLLIKKRKTLKKKKVVCQNLIILEGFSKNGYQIRIQRKKLRISTLVKIDVGHFLKNAKVRDLQP